MEKDRLDEQQSISLRAWPIKEQVMTPVKDQALWFAEVRQGKTTIWAQLPGVDPNQEGITT